MRVQRRGQYAQRKRQYHKTGGIPIIGGRHLLLDETDRARFSEVLIYTWYGEPCFDFEGFTYNVGAQLLGLPGPRCPGPKRMRCVWLNNNKLDCRRRNLLAVQKTGDLLQMR